MFGNLFSANTVLFDMLDQQAHFAYQAAEKFQESLCEEIVPLPLIQIKSLEHDADSTARQCLEILHKTFITPIDRDQIYVLVSRIDDVIDSIDAAADCLMIYKIKKPTKELIHFSHILFQTIKEMQKAVQGLRNLKETIAIRKACKAVNDFEHQADDTLRFTLEDLFQNEQDPRQLIIWKQIYETLEETTDRCSDVADTIEGILLESD